MLCYVMFKGTPLFLLFESSSGNEGVLVYNIYIVKYIFNYISLCVFATFPKHLYSWSVK